MKAKRGWHRHRGSWLARLDEWNVNESEPSWKRVIVTGVLFVGLMAAMYGSVLLVAAWADVLPQ